MIEIVGKTNIDFMGKRTLAFACSGILILLGLVALVQIARGVANLSIDFSGGASVQVKFDKPVEIDAVRLALETNGLHQAELQEFVGTNKILVRVKTSNTMEEQVADRIVAAFNREFPGNGLTMESSMVIGPIIGAQLRQDALIAILVSMAGIVLYVSARFEMRFGVAAALAMTHDVLVVLGLFCLLDKEITLLVVTALLTLAGYSLTDKVVVFDRIRENLQARRRESATMIINDSINQVLSRTIVTSLTVVVVLIPLAVTGGEVLHDFSLALLWGIIIGTYSSIFVASPLLLLLPGRVSALLTRP